MAALGLTSATRSEDPGEQRVFAPCRSNCPVHIDVPGYLSAVAEGRFTDALEIVLDRNPLPSTCGRVCFRPCEEGCRRCLLDEPVAIARIKRAAADHGVYPVPRRPRPRPESIAVVGSGPAGLTAAYDLAKLGFKVTIYDERPKPGGMLRYGIPAYRLPSYALDRDIAYVLSMGVSVQTSVRVGADVSVEELVGRHSAVLMSVGLQGGRPLPIPGADLPRVTTALPFLAASTAGRRVPIGGRVVVVGGGNVAIDVARTARRHGAGEVRVVCVESRSEMPAAAHEVEEAEIEGVHVQCSWGPLSILGESDVEGLEVVRCTSAFDADGRFAPSFDEDDVRHLPADDVIFAIGQGADVVDLGLPVTDRGGLQVDASTMRTPVHRVYAAGDVTTGPTKVIDAIASGRRAAAAIVADLTGDRKPLDALEQESCVLGKVPDRMASKLETRRRVRMERLEPFEAVCCFDEVEEGYTEYEAAREAQRCLSCTAGARLSSEKCALCLTCVRVCPHEAPGIVGGSIVVDADACHACGACASQCPAEAIGLEGHSEEEMSRRVQRVLATAGMDTALSFSCGFTACPTDLVTADTRSIRVSCLLRVSERSVLEALRLGASRVVFGECAEEHCRFPHAQGLVSERAAGIAQTLAELGLGEAFVVAHRADEDVFIP